MVNELPIGWSWITLGDIQDPGGRSIVSGPFGSNIGSRFFVDSGVPLIRGNNLTTDLRRFIDDGFVFITEEKAEELSGCHAFPGDLIFTAAGSLGQVGLIPLNAKYPKYVISNKQLRARLDKKKAHELFVYYWFASPEMVRYVQQRNTGSSVPLINLSILRSLPIPLPPLSEQRAIAEVLGALDDKIELNRRMNQTLEAMAAALFKEWFVDNEEARGWETGKLGDSVQINAKSITKDYSYRTIEYIDIASVSKGHLSETVSYTLESAPSRARRLVKHGDTIWSTVRPNRKSYLFIDHPKDNLVVSTGYVVLTPVKIPPSYLYFWVITDQFVDYLVSNADGSAYPAVLPERFAEADMLLPPTEVLDSFENIVGVLLARIAHNANESRTLAGLRDALLPKLMRGEVRVKDAVL